MDQIALARQYMDDLVNVGYGSSDIIVGFVIILLIIVVIRAV